MILYLVEIQVTLAGHSQLNASVAASVAILSSLENAVINLPIIWRAVKDKAVVKRFTIELITIVFSGLAVIWADQSFALSDHILQLLKS
ncbi:hypothetical protein [Mucilaginibacter sp.]